MVIERDARRYLYDLCDNKDEPQLFFAALGHLNSVANVQGQGRQDFKPELLQLNLSEDSRQVRQLMQKCINAFDQMMMYAE